MLFVLNTNEEKEQKEACKIVFCYVELIQEFIPIFACKILFINLFL